jgi:phage FluMu protein Com
MQIVRCQCGKRLFDASGINIKSGFALIEIWCKHCKKLLEIKIDSEDMNYRDAKREYVAANN